MTSSPLQGRNQAFTLLEVLVSLTLLSIFMGMTINILWPFEKSLSDTVDEIIDIRIEAKNTAIFNGHRVYLDFYNKKILLRSDEDILKELVFSGDIQIVEVNDVSVIAKNYSMAFSKLGLSDECLITISNNNILKLLYFPTVGKALVFDEEVSMKTIHEDYL